MIGVRLTCQNVSSVAFVEKKAVEHRDEGGSRYLNPGRNPLQRVFILMLNATPLLVAVRANLQSHYIVGK